MQRLSFLMRIAFVANLFFVLSLVMQWRSIITNAGLASTVLILGYFLAPVVFNPLAIVTYAYGRWWHKKEQFPFVNRLACVNVLFWLVQLAYFVFFAL